MKSRSLPLNKRGLNFEMLMWIVTRLTALAMYALLLTAVIGALIMGARTQMNLADVIRWGFMPNALACAKHERARPGSLGINFLANHWQCLSLHRSCTWRTWIGRHRG